MSKLTQPSFGKQFAAQRMICGACNHGIKGDFYPLEEASPCPACDNQRRHKPLSDYLESMIGQELWLPFCGSSEGDSEIGTIPVTVTRISRSRKVEILLNEDKTIEVEVSELYSSRSLAYGEACRLAEQAGRTSA